MLDLNSIMIGSQKPADLAEFYQQVLGAPPDWSDENWFGWQIGSCHLTIGEHSEVQGKASEPERIIINFETDEVKDQFERIKKLGANVIKEPYEMAGITVATFADPDGNFFQLMSPMDTGAN